jgi:DNA topoisomerase IA
LSRKIEQWQEFSNSRVPAKAKTIEKFLGSDFQVESSYGHIADFVSKEIGVDVEMNLNMKYLLIKG